MGGAGAATFGLLRARHVAWVSATYGQWIPRNHRPSRLQQLSGLWGSPQANLGGVWDRMDLTRVLAESSEARDQALFLRHGKDDPIIHFGAVVHPSPRTGRSVYQALQHHRVGHVAVWDEGGHVREDPRLPAGWWSAGWNPIFDGTSSLRRDASFPAFSACSLDRDPGDGLGDGRPWDADAGYSGDPNVADDTGWTGQRAGARNRFCRWDATQAVDTLDQWSMPLRLASSGNGAASVAGDPTLGDTLPASSATVDVTPRRVQAFRCAPGEVVRWSFAGQSGSVTADLDGAVTVPGLTLTAQWETLTLSR